MQIVKTLKIREDIHSDMLSKVLRINRLFYTFYIREYTYTLDYIACKNIPFIALNYYFTNIDSYTYRLSTKHIGEFYLYACTYSEMEDACNVAHNRIKNFSKYIYDMNQLWKDLENLCTLA